MIITVNELSYAYPGNTSPAVRGIGFKINEGEIFGFLGPSGAGKSTTQKILIRLLKNYTGSIEILNRDLHKWNYSFYNHIGVCFELPNHYAKLTALENLKFFASFYDNPVYDAVHLLTIVGLAEDANKKLEDFSKGMKMRLNFVRSLIHDPEILFLDEPTAGLDPVNARNVKNIILDLKKQGKTIFITTHNMHDADELCDRVAFITDGELRIIDSPKQLKLQNGKRKVLVEYEKGQTLLDEFDLDGLADNKAFMDILKNEKLISIHSEEASLDDVFIKVTGKTLI